MQLLDKMLKYEMVPTRTVGATEQTQDAGRMDRQTDGRSETDIPPKQLHCAEGIITLKKTWEHMQLALCQVKP